jgi:uncharacterized GH25 family protein
VFSRLRSAAVAALLAAAALGGTADAHDFWLQPDRFQVAPGAPVSTDLLVGHGVDRSAWAQPASRVRVLKSVGPTGVEADLRPALAQRRANEEPFSARFSEPGVHLLVLEGAPSVSVLPAPRFAMYLREEGLTPIAALRERAGLADTPGRELYSRRAKALVRVGDAARAQAHVARPVGLDLEIVPSKDPYALGPDERLPFRVLFKGRPLAGALVKLTRLEADEKPYALARTGRSGQATFDVPREGAWVVSVVWSTPLADDPRAEFETVFSSLTFGWPGTARQ